LRYVHERLEVLVCVVVGIHRSRFVG
jgi:hypothetical protein